jgi:hypothetical protein
LAARRSKPLPGMQAHTQDGTAIGIRSSVDATDYIQLYESNADTLRRSLHRIQATAKTILSALPLCDDGNGRNQRGQSGRRHGQARSHLLPAKPIEGRTKPVG